MQPLLNAIDKLLETNERIIVALEGMSAAGKSTLATRLKESYPCSVISMDHFFLRPTQRTPERLATPGGNIDYERFKFEVLEPLKSSEAFSYRPFDCTTQRFSDPVVVTQQALTVVEGVYSMHPSFSDNTYSFSVFMQIDEETQRSRLRERAPPPLYKRFINTWIPMENKYFEHFGIRDRCDYVL